MISDELKEYADRVLTDVQEDRHRLIEIIRENINSDQKNKEHTLKYFDTEFFIWQDIMYLQWNVQLPNKSTISAKYYSSIIEVILGYIRDNQ